MGAGHSNYTQTISRPSGSSKQITYDASSRVTSIANGAGTWTYGYTTSGATTTVVVTDPKNNKKTYTVNAATGALASYADALGRTTS